MQTATLFYTFDFVKDKSSILCRVAEIPYFPVKIFNALLSTYLAMVFSYPFQQTREVVDFWPKNSKVGDPFKGNYRRAATWMMLK